MDEVVDEHGIHKCPACGAWMVPRNGPHGEFMGCSKFPRCRGSRPKPLPMQVVKEAPRKWSPEIELSELRKFVCGLYTEMLNVMGIDEREDWMFFKIGRYDIENFSKDECERFIKCYQEIDKDIWVG